MHEGHRDRLRERYLKEGMDNFEMHNVLEFILFYAIPRKDTNEIAHELLETFGSFAGVLDAPLHELMKVKGVGKNTAVYLKMQLDVMKKYAQSKETEFEIVNSPESAGKILIPAFLGVKEEEVHLLCLDAKKKLIKKAKVFRGAINAVSISVRKIVEVAISCQACSAIVAHNHPSGIALPSHEDLTTTIKIKDALELVGVKLDDHIIVADNDFVSLADSSLLSEDSVLLYLKQNNVRYERKGNKNDEKKTEAGSLG